MSNNSDLANVAGQPAMINETSLNAFIIETLNERLKRREPARRGLLKSVNHRQKKGAIL